MPKNQNTLPPRLLSQLYHDVDVCQRREASEATVTMDPLMNNQKKQKKKKATSTKKESYDKNAVAIVKSVSQMGCVSQDSEFFGFSKRQTSLGKPDVMSWDRFVEYDSLNLRHVKRVSGTKKKTIAWE